MEGTAEPLSVGVQTGGEAVEAAVQWEAAALTTNECHAQLYCPGLTAFLPGAAALCEEALQQNELADFLPDDFAGLMEEDGPDGQAAAGASSASQAEGLVERASFTDITYSKGKLAAAVQWHPTRRGVLAVSCTAGQAAAPADAAARVRQAGRPPLAYILVWTVRDPVQPEAILEAPAEVLAFQFHPSQPNLVAGGCATGQVLLWDLGQLPEAGSPTSSSSQQVQPAAAGQPKRSGSNSKESQGEGQGSDSASKRRALPPVHVSFIDASHRSSVTHLCWLPGQAVTRDGRFDAAPSSGASGAGPAECHLFASVGTDGRLLVWDHRISVRQRRGARGDDSEAPEWKPVLGLAAHSSLSQPLLASRLCSDPRAVRGGCFVLGSLEGEVVRVDADAYSIERKGDKQVAHHTVRCIQGHAGGLLALAYSPFFDDLLLSVGHSGFVIWQEHGGQGQGPGQEGSCKPVLESAFTAVPGGYTAGCWSPSKPGVVLLGRADGKLEVWNLLERKNRPALVTAVSPAPITSLAFTGAGAASARGQAAASQHHQVLAVGDAVGVVRLLEVPRALRRRGHNEVKQAAALIQREAERLERVTQLAAERSRAQLEAEAAQRAAEAQALVHAGGGAAGGTKAQQADVEPSAEEQAEACYRELEAAWRLQLGLKPAGFAAL